MLQFFRSANFTMHDTEQNTFIQKLNQLLKAGLNNNQVYSYKSLVKYIAILAYVYQKCTKQEAQLSTHCPIIQ